MSNLLRASVYSTVLLAGVCTAILLAACNDQSSLPNPASEYCVANGGTVDIREGPLGQYGVCAFPDGNEAEEWAMYRGEVPVGGVEVSGYVTPAAQYCVITGGTYTATANIGTPNEEGTCSLENGQVCEASQYYDGTCSQPE